jgi:hypothetical protein
MSKNTKEGKEPTDSELLLTALGALGHLTKRHVQNAATAVVQGVDKGLEELEKALKEHESSNTPDGTPPAA